METILKIVITGGSCSGKTLGIKYVVKKLRALGWRPFAVPEAATIIIDGGVYDMKKITAEEPTRLFLVQKRIAETQLALEDEFGALAKDFPGEKRVILCDRGIADQIGYIGIKQLEKILREKKISPSDVYARYDAVIHLVTAAIGAEKHFNCKNNKARYENLKGARDLDRRILGGWRSHKNLIIIDNSTGFKKKKERLFRAVCNVLGIRT